MSPYDSNPAPEPAAAAELDRLLAPMRQRIRRPAAGRLVRDYLCPGGPYPEQWDWDGFFMGVALAAAAPEEAVYLQGWCLNFIYNSDEAGFTPGCVTPEGRDARLHQMKPFLAQGAWLASHFLGDLGWLAAPFEGIDPYARLKTIVDYRAARMQTGGYGLCVWYDAMESGADNNVAFPFFSPDHSDKQRVAGADLNAFLYREYLALAGIARGLGRRDDEARYSDAAAALAEAINRHLWCAEDGTYYNLDVATGQLIRRHSYSNVVPLWAGLAPLDAGRTQIRRYLLDPGKLWALHGIRTLAADDPQYNNQNIIKPYSNWQGPVWPIANYLYMHALLAYGFQAKAAVVAQKMVTLCLDDIRATGGMHENYHADTGEPLAAPGFISWNILVPQMPAQAATGIDPFALE